MFDNIPIVFWNTDGPPEHHYERKFSDELTMQIRNALSTDKPKMVKFNWNNLLWMAWLRYTTNKIWVENLTPYRV